MADGVRPDGAGTPWYALCGPDNDVVVSCRVRLARNLANFPFPGRFRGDDALRVQALVFDALSKQQERAFRMMPSEQLSPEHRRILEERGVLKRRHNSDGLPETGVAVDFAGASSCLVNCVDHIRIAGFAAGMQFPDVFDGCRIVDSFLQESLQIAASPEFGFLTACFRDAGSGMKLSAMVHIPAVCRAGAFRALADSLRQNGCAVVPAFPLPGNRHAGAFFIVQTAAAMAGSEVDQIAAVEASCRRIMDEERKISAGFADTKSTVVCNAVIRAYSIAKFSMLVSMAEAVDIISDLKLALRLNMLSGISDSDFCGLLYRIQPGHLAYIEECGSFSFEADVGRNPALRVDRLRAVTLQEAFEKITLGNV